MNEAITLKGIGQAIEGLNYRNKNALKYRLIYTIREFYHDDSSVETLKEIETEKLIGLLWNEANDPAAINHKRKNLNSLKSSINTDLKKLYAEDKNPEGIIIGPNNIFSMSDEAKDNTLKTFLNTVMNEGQANLGEVAKALSAIDKILSDAATHSVDTAKDNLNQLDELKKTIRLMSEKYGGFNHEGSLESAQNNFQNKSSRDGSEQIGTGSEVGSKDGLADKSGYITDFETDKEAGVGIDQSLPEIVEAIDTIEDDEELEIIEEVESDGLEENIGLGGENGNSIGNNSCEDLSGKENYSTEDGEKYQEPGGIGPADSSKEGNAGGALSKDNIFETETANDIDTGDELELQDEQIDELEEEVEIIDAIDNDEDLEIIEDIEPDGPEENIVLADEYGDSASSDSNAKLVEEDFDIGENNASNIKNAKVLAEEFNHSLAAMDKYYNQYILIQGGSYIIGSKRPKRGECSEEKVNLPDYYIGKYPVINALFEVFTEKTGYKTTAEKRGYSKVYIGRYEKTIDEQTGMEKLIFNATTIQKTVEGACWYQPCGPGSTIHKKRNHPVVHVSFEDAMAFAAWTGKKLPSENEWEAASRTDKGYSLPWGNSFNKKACNIEESSVCGTTPVDRYEEFENNFGIADVLGNVLEWTSSRIEKFMVVKGGSFISGDDVRLFTRFQIEPVNHSNILGFRCMAH